ncbi:Tyrosine recombinase XerC [termite gut metagenome]|uniref:Tyrosine recombinase XerC n=1 Tax=termite gut metagenome TaxID=433724 RepID=A0A5J4QYC4_9ZZZZ
MIKYAICEGIIIGDPFTDYAPLRPKPEQKYLTRKELDKIMNSQLDHPNRYLARDMFLFSCFTGLAYRDMRDLSPQDIVEADDGVLWIKTTRQKTGTPCEIPLMELPIQILQKYRSLAPEGRLLLMLSCKRMNINLQKIGKICGIKRRLTFHMGRHTYASEITLSQGVPIETVSRMLGHRDLRSTRIYAKITNEKIDEDMKKLEKRISKQYQLAQ